MTTLRVINQIIHIVFAIGVLYLLWQNSKLKKEGNTLSRRVNYTAAQVARIIDKIDNT